MLFTSHKYYTILGLTLKLWDMEDQEVLSYREETNLHFNSKAYLQRFTDPHDLWYHAAILKCWHTFYQEHGKEFDPTKTSMLEFGGGPTVWDLISVTPFVSSITFTDFADTSRTEIQLWKSKNPDGEQSKVMDIRRKGIGNGARAHKITSV